MRKIIGRILIVVGILIAVVLALLVTAGVLLNTTSFQNKLMGWATDALTEKLQTEVKIDSVDVDFLTYNVRLYGLSVNDLQQQPMVKLERVEANVDLLSLLHRQVKVSSVEIAGLRANLYKSHRDSAANYQFIIDAFRKPKKDSLVVADSLSVPKKKSPVKLDINKVKFQDISLTYKTNKDLTLGVHELLYVRKRDKHQIAFKNLLFATDNHRPRKNTGKPKRGFFDAGHLNLSANGKLTFNQLTADTFQVSVDYIEASDPKSGIDVKKITTLASGNSERIHFEKLAIRLPETTLDIAEADLQLPSKKKNRPLHYRTGFISGHVILKDISKCFAPILSKFSLPLILRARMEGDNQSMRFSNIQVTTADKKFQVSANGRLTNLSDKYKLAIRFNVTDMKARGDVKKRIINQFPVKKFMMNQLDALGTIIYKGNFNVLWKREEFMGRLTTDVGHLNFNFALDEINKYVIGKANSNDLMLGNVFDMKDIGMIDAEAAFRFDISKARTFIMRRKKGGKLPIGNVNAKVNECSWKSVKVRNIEADIVSDGAVAEGKITILGRHTDLVCSFSFTSTDSIKSKLKLKPGIRFHALSDENRAIKEQKKQDRLEQKQKEKEQRALEKQIRKQQKEANKQAKAQLKAEENARKAEEKAQRKAEEKARKQEEKIRKAEEKERKKAEKAQKKAEKEATR